ncbi:MAG TPA: SDR family NAD(P)-dependent oxidoreductase [Bacillota bacterium]|jgi:3-oxoacyl-[acyl-carrier protein] reductase|nr:SDR family oxidoreductase [Bacillota bacterium]HPZ10738.1 SDR family NAD(P)-dependent oxidoreductase [Bacillota bacterium]
MSGQQMFSLAGKVALVTGASRGIGRADALALARAGADVVITDILLESDADEKVLETTVAGQLLRDRGVVYAEQTAEEIRQLGRRAAVFKMDVTDREQVARVVTGVVKEFGRIDILVNNAAMLDHVATIENQNDKLWERDLRINLTGAYNCAKAVWPHMKEQHWGRIINMSSVAGTMGGFGQASYSSTKAGVIGLTRSLALEGARYQITSNAIVPGIIGTEAWKMGNPKMNERMIARTAFRRPGEPEDIAHAVVFLASEEAKYITGIELYVAGGINLFTF